MIVPTHDQPTGQSVLVGSVRQLGKHHQLPDNSAAPSLFCHSPDGWGPLSPSRWDTTPCFLSAFSAGIAMIALVSTVVALARVNKMMVRPLIKPTKALYAKLGLICCFTAVSLASSAGNLFQLGLIEGPLDVDSWAPLVVVAAVAAVGLVMYEEHFRLRYTHALPLVFWMVMMFVSMVRVHTAYAVGAFKPDGNRLAAIAAAVQLVLSTATFAVELFVPVPGAPTGEIRLEDEDLNPECPYEYANIFSLLSFDWVTRLMRDGARQPLEEQQLWALRDSDKVETVDSIFSKYWNEEKAKKKPRLWNAILKTIWPQYGPAIFFKSTADVVQFLMPFLLKRFIRFISIYRADPANTDVFEGIVIAAGMFALSTAHLTLLHQYFSRTFESGMRSRAGLTAALYRKSLVLATGSNVSGQVGNLMSSDVPRVDDFLKIAHMLWSGPFQLIIVIVSLYQLIGLSMFAGLAAMALLVPINVVLSRAMKTLQRHQMVIKDSRVKLVTEMLTNIKNIKLYNWTRPFLARLDQVRNGREIPSLRKKGLLASLQSFSWSTSPVLVSSCSFGAYVLVAHGNLSSEIVFPALAVFNMIAFPLGMIPAVITSWIEASVAVGRMSDFLLLEEVQRDAVVEMEEDEFERSGYAVVVSDATFYWTRPKEDADLKTQDEEENGLLETPVSWLTGTQAEPVLADLSVFCKAQTLTCLIGSVGSGKSAFLQALLGNLWRTKGSVSVYGSVAYVPQSAWIMSGTVRENILFTLPLNQRWYDKVVKACALLPDLSILPGGDLALVGERGLSLSGGQRARIALARAVYAQADVYVLDDILSAVDAHVANRLIEGVLGSKGLLAGKTRILATHQMPVIEQADSVLFLRNGVVVERGTQLQLISKNGAARQFITQTRDEDEANPPEESEAETALIQMESEDELEAFAGTASSDEDGAGKSTSGGWSRASRRRMSHRSAASAVSRGSGADSVVQAAQTAPADTERGRAEVLKTGSVGLEVYMTYMRLAGLGSVTVYVVLAVLAQGTQVMASMWLKRWAERSSLGLVESPTTQLAIYAGIGIFACFLICCQTLTLWLLCALSASRRLHDMLAEKVFHSPMVFFETVAFGQLLNRFSGDITRIDSIISRAIYMLFNSLIRSLATLVVICYATPAFGFFLLPLMVVYWMMQRYFLSTSRQVRRIDAVAVAPIHGHFQESLTGQSTIRAFRKQSEFEAMNVVYLEAKLRAIFVGMAINRWLGVRLESLGSVVIMVTSMLAIVSTSTGGGPTAGMVGLALSYALQITGALNWIVRQSSDLETNLVSVERLVAYKTLEQEEPDMDSQKAAYLERQLAGKVWNGEIQFIDYSTRYRKNLEPALLNVNLNIKAGERVGVVGRTGSGKSTLAMSLFRIIEAARPITDIPGSWNEQINPHGRIMLDGNDIAKMPLEFLRRNMAVIPQDLSFFSGTVRQNLDPNDVILEDRLESVLETPLVQAAFSDKTYTSLSADSPSTEQSSLLDREVGMNGSLLSQGQRQILSVARALLSTAPILVLDEATSSVDGPTDTLVQELLRTDSFQHKTILTIAHRLRTVLDYDRIVVLSKGEVAEVGTVKDLVAQGGMFYDLVREAGLLGEIEGVGGPIKWGSLLQ